ncbi:hypothetical protein JHK87_050065 [Glycine soja]|nr:hypothetical protein JHK87_050065 [Glycine soja]
MLLVQHHNICSLPKIRFPQNHQEDDEEESDKAKGAGSVQLLERFTVTFKANC